MAWTYTRGIVRATNGVVATSHTLASQTGLHILRLGGSFADAAIAVSAVLCVVEPSASHAGGDGFAILWDGKRTVALNGSGRSPACGSKKPDWKEFGITSFTIPGLVRVWQSLHERYGDLPLSTILADAIRYAEEGAPVGSRWANAAKLNLSLLRKNADANAQFLSDGDAPSEGALLKQPHLAESLRAIAEFGPQDFYEGHLARKIVAGLQQEGSAISLGDLAEQQTLVLDPVSIDYRGHQIHGQPPPSQGVILLEELGILRGFETPPFGTAELIHLQVEAKKLSFADRTAYLGEQNSPIDHILSEEFLAQRRGEIWHDKTLPEEALPGKLGRSTTYFCIADAEGRAISFIQSVFYGWGSGVVVPGTGILLNNRMNGFDRVPGGPNEYAPGKRPVHTLNAYLATKDGKPAFVGGTPGAQVQVQTNLQIIQNLIDFGMDPQQAIEQPRWRHDEEGISLESRLPAAVAKKLKSLGHETHRLAPWGHGSAVQLIVFEPDGYAAASDPRAAGQALGW